MKRSSEAFWWALFSAGGVMAALFVPAFVIVTGFLLPSGDAAAAAERAAGFAGVVGRWPVRVVLFGVIALSFFHCGHRIRHTLMDLGLRRFSGPLKLPCYGGALAGTVWAAMLLWAL
ncbi:MAG: fumarate reductase subunit D [Gemmatimonadota bacterium]|nr:fumarate reductase subunit D [Gemmatimonadota bacterium]